MHVKPADRDAASAGASHSGRQLKEPSSLRKVRLGGGAARVPASNQTIDSPLRTLVSAIGQSLGARTPLRKQNGSSSAAAAAKNEPASCSTPVSSTRRMANNAASSSSQTPVRHTTSARVTITASTPRKSSLSSSSSATSSSSVSSSTPLKKHPVSAASSQTPISKKSSASSSFGSATRSSNNPTTPIARRGTTMPPRTPTAAAARTQNNPTTPVSKYTSIPTPAKKQAGGMTTPISKQPTTPYLKDRRQKNPTSNSPISKQNTVPPTTPVNGFSNSRTPLNTHGSNIPFYTPKSTLPNKSSLPSPLQPRDTNIPESSRRLHFGINLSAMAEQENLGMCTPRSHSSAMADATYSFDKNRLAQIKARRNAFQKLLTSPAQRVRMPETSSQPAHTPRRHHVGDENDPNADLSGSDLSVSHSPTRRRVANSLF
ncbi:hypothetical protein MPTK1_6g17120 [Marchantia polymorpha subsp. ruderalis]|uniref:Uncharacterized protein n=2 Tax=Marchantia polymorpha TaxID=3197 RepID=A0A176W1S3_MARPO|nr:hypothetical protein AXG93_131s1450 [Marchantia polymorpha subsp. ruderalis]PTQ29283.1 hypothetical protein MARPO_0144s0003 [Marchantia polymorpha]BBN15110.1 hypothetical protein Mp_6g17120 [Marchantia polymorpha subsp. ruderalis]|eukprot:PTQ29283.1 hypothetical protein MARPO_0144s0003 [Marchantia polymorpha]